MSVSSSEPAVKLPARGPLMVILLIVFLDLLGFGIIIPLLPYYVRDFEANPLKVTLLFSVYSICQFIGSPVLGALSDRYGRKPVLVLSQAGSAVGYVLLAMATQVNWGTAGLALAVVYASRVIDGFTGGNISTAQAYISDVTSPENRAKSMGMLGAAFGIGFSIGPAMGGLLGEIHISLPAYVAAGLSLGAAILTAIILPEHHVRKHGDNDTWLHPSRFAPILRKPIIAHLLGVAFLSMAAFVMMEATAALFLAKIFSYDKWQVGLFFAYIGVIIAVVQGGLIGRITKKYGEWVPATVGPALVAVGMALYCITPFATFLVILLVAGTLNAVGRSLFQPSVSSLLSRYADRDKQGITFGLFHGIMSLARVVGPIVAGVTYPLWRNTGAFAFSALMSLGVAIWMANIYALARRTPAKPGEFLVGSVRPTEEGSIASTTQP